MIVALYEFQFLNWIIKYQIESLSSAKYKLNRTSKLILFGFFLQKYQIIIYL